MSTRLDNGVLTLGPEINFETVPDIWQMIKKQVSELHTIDMSQVQQFDSSAVALVIECKKLAKKSKYKIEVKNVPADLLALAKVCGTEEML